MLEPLRLWVIFPLLALSALSGSVGTSIASDQGQVSAQNNVQVEQKEDRKANGRPGSARGVGVKQRQNERGQAQGKRPEQDHHPEDAELAGRAISKVDSDSTRIARLSAYSGMVAAVASLLTVFGAFGAVWFARRSWLESRRSADLVFESNRPYIEIDVSISDCHVEDGDLVLGYDIVLRNVGLMAAYHVFSFTKKGFTPHPTTLAMELFQGAKSAINNGLMIAPGGTNVNSGMERFPLAKIEWSDEITNFVIAIAVNYSARAVEIQANQLFTRQTFVVALKDGKGGARWHLYRDSLGELSRSNVEAKRHGPAFRR